MTCAAQTSAKGQLGGDERIAQYALADDAKIRGLNRLQAAQSIFCITEVCKSQGASYRPANEAIEGVRRGDWRADLGTP